MCALRVAGARTGLRGAETRKRFILTLALSSQAFANKLKGAFHQGMGQKVKSFPSTFVLHIPACLLMWTDTGQGERLGKLSLYVLCWKCLVVVSKVRAYRPLSRGSSINELVILNWVCYPKPHQVNGAVKKRRKKKNKTCSQSWTRHQKGLSRRNTVHPDSGTVNWTTWRVWDKARDNAVCMPTALWSYIESGLGRGHVFSSVL